MFFILNGISVYGDDFPLIPIKKLIPDIVIELRYATENNFTGRVLYSYEECYLCEPTAKRLARVQKKLKKNNLSLKIWDCYRPLSVQKQLWAVVPDSRYVANPKYGSRHNRGASIDLTLVDKNGFELAMPTPFDDFTPKAHRNYKDLDKTVLNNRQTLQDAMESEGFIGLPTEWWHFDDPDWKKYALRDEPLESPSLKKDILTPPLALPNDVFQVVMVTAQSWDKNKGVLKRYEKKGKRWRKIGHSWPVSLGENGSAWGQGLHIPVGTGPQKMEGDKRTPAGMFSIGHSYGYAPEAPTGVQWPYQMSTDTWACIDDPTSAHYNQIIEVDSKVKKDWQTAERMKPQNDLYKWVINIEQNFPAVLKGSGSCIFFHIWKKKGSSTLGCTAMSEKKIIELLNWLDKSKNPVLVHLPISTYKSVKKSWKLP